MQSLLPLVLMWYHFITYCKWISYAKNDQKILFIQHILFWACFQCIKDILAFDAHMKVMASWWHQEPLLHYWLGNRSLQSDQPSAYKLCEKLWVLGLTELEFLLDICQGA